MTTAPRATILVIDDEEAVRATFSAFLEDHGFAVFTAGDGREGLECFHRENPDLVLVDLRMPNVDGHQVIADVVRSDPERPIVVVSGTGVIDDAINAVRLGAWDYLLKPVRDMDSLVHAVEKALETARLRRQNREYQQNLETLVAERTAELSERNRELHQVNTRLSRIVAVANRLATCESLEDLGDRLLYQFHELVGAEASSMFLLREGRLRHILSFTDDSTTQLLPGPPGDYPLVERVIAEGSPLFLDDLGALPEPDPGLTARLGGGPIGLLPLLDDDGQPAGLILLHKRSAAPFSAIDQEIGLVLTSHGSAALKSLRSREALRKSEGRFRTLIDHAADAIILHDMDGAPVLVNQKACEWLGYPHGDLMATSFLDILAEPDAATVRRMWASLTPRHTLSMEGVCRRRDGSTFPIEANVGLLEVAGQALISTLIRDITERRRAEQDLRQSEARYRSVVEDQVEQIIRITPDGILTFVNDSFCRHVGEHRDALLGTRYFDRFSPEDQGSIRQALARLTPESPVATSERRIVFPDGSVHWEEWTDRLIPGPDGSPLEYQSVGLDITARKHLEEQVQQALKMEAIGRLAGGVTHDFNNLLTVIRVNSELALTRMDGDDPQGHFFKEILTAVDRAESLTRQLLAFSRKQVLKPRVLDLNQLLTDMERMLLRLIGEDIELAFRPAAALGHIKADPNQIGQVIMNLVVNARDAMPDGGRLDLVTGTRQVDDIDTATRLDLVPGPYVFCRLRDSGAGMDEAVQSRIFEPFFTTKERGKGTGLGLSTAYGIIQQSGGTIVVDSKPGAGATFTVYLPRVDAPLEASTSGTGPVGVADGHETVLVVEDEDELRRLVCQTLELHGYRTLEAPNAEAALKHCERHGTLIRLLVTDVVMPQMSGPELFEQVSASRPDLKVIFMSGYLTERQDHRAIFDNNRPFLQKPFSTSQLVRIVREVLDAPSSTGAH